MSNSTSNDLNNGNKELDLQWLLGLPCDKFIPEAFQAILGRVADTEGARHYAMRMAEMRNRLLVIAELRTSSEGQAYSILAQSAELDAVVTRYRAVRNWPLGRWRWLLFPRPKQVITDSLFDWQEWKYEVPKEQKAQSTPHALVENDLEFRLLRMEREINTVVDFIANIRNDGENKNIDIKSNMQAQDWFTEAQLVASSECEVSWEARTLFYQMAQKLKKLTNSAL